MPVKGKQADAMRVADYGPSSQTLTFLDPEDDLGSLGIGADTQVMITACLLSVFNKKSRAMAMTFTIPCQASPSIWKNPSGQDHNCNATNYASQT